MYDSSRRPYHNRSENLLQRNQIDDAQSMESNRFWKLLTSLRRKQQTARAQKKQQDNVQTG